MFTKIKHLDRLLDQEWPLLILLLILVILRVPNFFEPYWYGDEGIYLTIGHALRHGAVMYLNIIDHKTPLIYFLAMVTEQNSFRLINLIFSLFSTVAFYHLALILFKKIKLVFASSLVFLLLTTLPALEGNIPNAELIVISFSLWSLLLLFHTRLFKDLADNPILVALSKFLDNTHDLILYILAGILFGLAILTKVPAIFELGIALFLGWLLLWKSFNKNNFFLTSWRILAILLPVILVVAASIIYFWGRGALQAYLDYGLLYNFKYVQNWGLPFTNKFLLLAFTLPGKFALSTVLILLLSALYKFKKITLNFAFILAWFFLSLFASLLSNRNYPHYFIQLVPSSSLLIIYLISKIKKLELALGLFSLLLLTGIFVLLKFGFYPTFSYYQRFADYALGKIDQTTYYQQFDFLMTDNYQVAKIISQSDDDYLFIWGTNPVLYALTQKMPIGRFTVSFHIKDFAAQTETLNDFKNKQPQFAVVMDNEEDLPGLNEYLYQNYIVNANFEHFSLWMKMVD